jgi:polyhydroxyalkanoate synthesis regulator phasin
MTPLNKEDFTEEQWEAIMADMDRARLQASETARKNARKEFEAELQRRLEEALAEERQKMEMSEQEKLEAERAKIEQLKNEVARERRLFKATKTLLNAGFKDEQLEAILPLFENVGDDVLDTSLEKFIQTNQSLIEEKVNAVKQELLGNATLPESGSTSTPSDPTVLVKTALEQGNDAAAIETLLSTTATK